MPLDNPSPPSGASNNETRLLEAAVEVFAEQGYDKTGVAEIARRAGLTTGAIYSRYRGKADLLVAALDAQMAQRLEKVFATPGIEDATQILSLLGTHLLEDDDPTTVGLFLEAVVAARREPDLADMLERALEGERTRMSKVIDEAKSDGLFDPALDTHAIITFIQAIGLGFMVFHTNRTPMPDRDEWQIVIDRVITAALPPQEKSKT